MTMKKKWTTTQHRPSVIWRLCIGYNGKFMKNYNRIHRYSAKWHGVWMAQKRSTLKVVTLPIMTVTWCGSIGDIWQQTRAASRSARVPVSCQDAKHWYLQYKHHGYNLTVTVSSKSRATKHTNEPQHAKNENKLYVPALRCEYKTTLSGSLVFICPSHFETHPEHSRLHSPGWPQKAATFDWNVAPFEDTEIQWRAEIFTLASIFIFFFFFLKTGRHGAAGSSLLEGWQGHEQKFTIHSPPVHCSCSSKNSSFWLESDRNFLFWHSIRQLSFLVPKLQNTDPTVRSAVSPPLHVFYVKAKIHWN